jgi:hypothetical protein
MDPWAIVSITILVIIGGIAIVGVSVGYFSKNPDKSVATKDLFLGIGDYVSTWFSLVPYAIFLAGPIADVFSSQLLYTKASLVGLAGIIATRLFGGNEFASFASTLLGWLPRLTKEIPPPDAGFFGKLNWIGVGVYVLVLAVIFLPMMIGQLSGWAWKTSSALAVFTTLAMIAGNGWLGDAQERYVTGDTSTSFAGITIEDSCTTPGLGALQTSFAPIGILLETSILFSHFWESVDTRNTQGMSITGGILAGTFAIEWAVLAAKGCLPAYKSGKLAPIVSLLLGALFGATGYYTMKETTEGFTTTQDEGVFHPPPAPEKKATSGVSDKKIFVGPQPETSEPVDDQDAFVCEAYKDGELVTSTLVE